MKLIDTCCIIVVNQEVLAIGSYQNSALHSFPNTVKVVSEIFSDFDAKGVFD